MLTIYLEKLLHGNLEFLSYTNLGSGILFEQWTINHGKEDAKYRSYTTYFESSADVDEEIIRRSARRLERGWKINRESQF